MYIPQRGGPTLTSIEAAYEIPSVPDQPLPDIPSPLCRMMKKKKMMEYMRQSLEITETNSQVWTGMISIANILYNNNMICM